jgi:hypothetical protein
MATYEFNQGYPTDEATSAALDDGSWKLDDIVALD